MVASPWNISVSASPAQVSLDNRAGAVQEATMKEDSSSLN